MAGLYAILFVIMLEVKEFTCINRENDIEEELEEDFDWNDPNL